MLNPGQYTENFQELLQELKHYLTLQKKYVSMDAADKLSVILSTATIVAVCLMLGGMILFFLSFALAHFIGEVVNSPALGFLIIALALLAGMIFIFTNRNRLIIQPFARFFINLMVNKEEEEDEDAE